MVKHALSALVAALAVGTLARAQLPTSEFLYQGQLKDTAGPVTTAVDLKFRLFGVSSGGTMIGSELWVTNLTPDAEGRFSAELDFGSTAFAVTDERWLEIDVRAAGGGAYTTLTPRQRLSASPRAQIAGRAPWAGLTGVPAGFADGTDDGVTAAGTGLSLSGNTLSLDLAYTDARYYQVNNVLLNGDASGNINSVTVQRLQGRGVSAALPAHNHVLTWDINQFAWVPMATQHWPPGQGMQNIVGSYAVDYAVLDQRYLNQNIIINGDATGLYNANTVVALHGRAVSSAAPGANHVLKWNGTQWAPAVDASNVYLAGSGLTLTSNQFSVNFSTLSGTYVDEGQLAGGDATGTFGNLTVAGLRGRAVASNAPAVNDTLKWTGAQWSPAADANSVTSVSPPLNLVSGNLALTANSIGAAQLASDAASLADVSGGNLSVVGGTQINSSLPLIVTGVISSSSTVTGAAFNLSPVATRRWAGSYLEWRLNHASVGQDLIYTSNGVYGNLFSQTFIMDMPLHLPDGAIVTEIEFYALDNNGNNATFELIRVPHNGTAPSSVASVATSSSTTSVRIFTLSTSHTIANNTYAYLVRATWNPGSQPANIRLHGVHVAYTVAAPLP